MNIIEFISREFSLKKAQTEQVISLIDEGNTIPFIARYRKELTGSLDDQILRKIFDRLTYLRGLDKRRTDILKAIDEQGKLTDEIKSALNKAITMVELEDIYRPFKQKRRTRATIAVEKGLKPLAKKIFAQNTKNGSIEDLAMPFVNSDKGVETLEDAIAGASDIIADQISDDAELRKYLRSFTNRLGYVKTKASKDEDSVYQMYYDYSEQLNKVAGHRVLAIDRGERESFLKVSIDIDKERAIGIVNKKVLKPGSITTKIVEEAAKDGFERLIFPSIEREVRNELTDNAQESAINVFAINLKNLLMQPPIKGIITLGLDPAYRTGCKIAVVDETGKVLDTTVIYPTPPQSKIADAKAKLKALIKKHNVGIISIGNGTASKESEMFVAELIREIDSKVSYMVVNEAGASVYSASQLAAKEFPDYDVTLRSAISIARRLQDPLAELVKIDPKSIGVGQYQHDMKKARLDESLSGVVENCVNSVGVDLNTASVPLLSFVSGIGGSLAKNIVGYRDENGEYQSRSALKKVPKLGPKAFEQCAGFLRIPESKNILDNTGVHPESYKAVQLLLDLCGYKKEDVKAQKIRDIRERVKKIGSDNIADKIGIGEPTLLDIIDELLKPGRDPRDELPKPMLRTDVLDMNDLTKGMELTGTVRNAVDFGVFVDIGVHQDGLVHISQICDRYIKHPSEVVKVGDIVTVWVMSVDVDKKRISLTMKKPV